MQHERTSKRRDVRLPRGRFGVGLGILAAFTLVAVAAFQLLREDDGTRTLGGTPAPFSLEYPASWKPFDQAELAAFPQPPLAVLRQEDGQGILVLRIEKPFAGNLQKFAVDLRDELDKRLNDFREVRARVVSVRAGNAFFYSYVREQRGTVHTIALIPAGPARSYVITTVSQPGADDTAREIGAMVASFALTRP